MLISKSKYLIGLQCPKYFWTAFHDPDKIPKPDAATERKFEQGNLVGDLAKESFPGGIDIPSDDFMGNINQTKELLNEKKPLFEAGIMVDSLFSRADVLNPVGDEWDIIEVKSSTKVKDINLHDVSFQKHVYEKAGLKIRKCFLMHINNEYVKKGDIDPKALFTIEDITEQVNELFDGVQERVDNMKQILSSKTIPDSIIGKQCKDPYDCPIDSCWNFLPENHIFELYRGGRKSFELLEKDILAIADIPDDFKLTGKQEIQKNCEKTGKPYIDKSNIKQFLKGLQCPLYYLDFETFSPVVPMFEGTRPYRRIPFQYSLHIVDSDGSIKHHSFLASGTDDPRPEFIASLKSVLGDKGSVVVWNESFEKGVLNELAADFPSYEDWKNGIIARVVDLLVPFRNFHYYDPVQKGSASIKKVLPALTGKSYSDLDINNGEDASISFLTTTYGEVSEEEKEKVRSDLEKYCCLDTEGMIWILDELKKLV
ncbi:DUF2779 domain-containing protein [Nanoarchaeota archaeon]